MIGIVAGLSVGLVVALLSGGSPALPEARYDTVIPGLGAWVFGSDAAAAYSLGADVTLYGSPGGTPVATLAARDFLGHPTVVVAVDVRGDWARVLTPARQRLPSTNGGTAPAQTSGWIDADALIDPVPLRRRIVVSVSAQTLAILANGTIEKTFPVGVGTAEAPTPTGVTGYLQARYLDPAQQQSAHPVQLTSLHSSAADEPFGGDDGGLIGLHYEKNASGTVSHGCVRLSAAAVSAVNSLPLGTLVTIVG